MEVVPWSSLELIALVGSHIFNLFVPLCPPASILQIDCMLLQQTTTATQHYPVLGFVLAGSHFMMMCYAVIPFMPLS
jgi:hypothetical protein